MISRQLLAAAAAAGLGLALSTAPAEANQDNWGNPPDVCDQAFAGSYENGWCAPAISPQQTVKGTTSLQYIVPCNDAPDTSPDGTPYWQSLGYLVNPEPQYGSAPYDKEVAWTSPSSVVSGEATTVTAASGAFVSSTSWSAGTTPVKVYNAEIVGESTSVTFAAGCLNSTGVQEYVSVNATALATGSREPALNSPTLRRILRPFVTGARERAEFTAVLRTRGGHEVHRRITLESRDRRTARLSCPDGTRRAGRAAVSYGFDSFRDTSSYRAPITQRRDPAPRRTDLTFRTGDLRYPTVAYLVQRCERGVSGRG